MVRVFRLLRNDAGP